MRILKTLAIAAALALPLGALPFAANAQKTMTPNRQASPMAAKSCGVWTRDW